MTIGSTVTADYTYDGLERMAVRTTQNMTPAGTTHYLYDRAGHLIAEADDTGATLREYVWLDDMPLAVVADVDTVTPHLYYVHVDHLNRPIMMTDAAKTVVWNAVYKPFGESVSITGSASNNLRFPGQYFLIEDGLAYNWHRHYDATIGRYLQPDPLGLLVTRIDDSSDGDENRTNDAMSSSLNGSSLYSYAVSSPVMRSDFQGLLVLPNLHLPPSICIPVGTRSPTFRCSACGAPTGGVYLPLCPDCHVKSQGGVEPKIIIRVPKPQK